MAWGILQVSWSLGTALVTALRVADETGLQFFKNFKGYNRAQGNSLCRSPTPRHHASRPHLPTRDCKLATSAILFVLYH